MTNSATCIKCGTTNLIWNKSKAGKWYLGIAHQYDFEDGNAVITHIAAHNCVPTPEGLAAMEARQAERKAELEAEQAKIDAYKAEQDKLRHVDAEIGEKVTLTGVVIMSTKLEGQFGAQKLLVIKTDSYEVAKMITTAEWAWNVDFDERITIQGTVKSHDLYQGKAQTLINRPKLV